MNGGLGTVGNKHVEPWREMHQRTCAEHQRDGAAGDASGCTALRQGAAPPAPCSPSSATGEISASAGPSGSAAPPSSLLAGAGSPGAAAAAAPAAAPAADVPAPSSSPPPACSTWRARGGRGGAVAVGMGRGGEPAAPPATPGSTWQQALRAVSLQARDNPSHPPPLRLSQGDAPQRTTPSLVVDSAAPPAPHLLSYTSEPCYCFLPHLNPIAATPPLPRPLGTSRPFQSPPPPPLSPLLASVSTAPSPSTFS